MLGRETGDIEAKKRKGDDDESKEKRIELRKWRKRGEVTRVETGKRQKAENQDTKREGKV